MASFKVTAVNRIQATLHLNPTDTDDPVAGYGTRLGVHDNISATIGWELVRIANKLSGYENFKIVTQELAIITAFQRNFDEDLLPLMFESTSTEQDSLKPLITDNAGFSQRILNEGSANSILLAPKEPDKHEGIILYNVVTTIPNTNDMDFQIDKDWGHPIIFQGFVEAGATRRVFQWGRLQDMDV